MFVEKHIQKFLEISEPPQDTFGLAPRKWADRFPRNEIDDYDRLSPVKMTRRAVMDLCRDRTTSDLNVYISIMAWGGQGSGVSFKHAKAAWECRDEICEIIHRLRSENPTKIQAFEWLNAARINGLGPSFFTKLIAFISPEDGRVIMDQWVAKAVNLLTGREFVKLAQGVPNRANDGFVYAQFCGLVAEIGLVAGIDDPWRAEERLFSSGGRKKGPWRQYVIEHWRPASRPARHPRPDPL